MSGDSRTEHWQAQSVAILAIGTGALGFGLFATDFRLSTDMLPALKCAAAGFALAGWVALAQSVNVILRIRAVSGRQVARGPLARMFLVVIYVSTVFVIGVFDAPPTA